MKGLSLLDTNILVYAFAQTEDDHHAKAKALVMDLLAEHDGCASVQVLKGFHAVAAKKAAAPLSRRDAAGIVRDLCISCHITGETVQQLRRASDLSARYGISVWDASIVAAVEAAGCVRLYSEDLADGATLGTVRIINPLDLPRLRRGERQLARRSDRETARRGLCMQPPVRRAACHCSSHSLREVTALILAALSGRWQIGMGPVLAYHRPHLRFNRSMRRVGGKFPQLAWIGRIIVELLAATAVDIPHPFVADPLMSRLGW